jgi:DNA topoisomerase-2
MALYEARKAHMVKTLKSEFERLENIVRFILEVISGTIVVSNRPKSALLDELEEKSYAKVADAYDYLLSLPLWSLTMERVQKLKKERAEKESELDRITAMSPTKMWLNDLSTLEDALSDLAIEGTAGPPPTLAFAAASAKPKKKVAKKKVAAKKVTAKKATVAAKKVEEDDDMSSDDGEFMSLFARIKKLQTGVAEPQPAKVTKPKTLRRKKEEKKEQEEEDVDAFSVSELSESLPSTPANRENSPKRKRKPRAKMTGLAALGMSGTVSSESPSMGKHAKKKVKQSTTTALRKRSTRAKKAVTYKYSDDDDACVVEEEEDDDDDFDATFSCSGSDSDWTG